MEIEGDVLTEEQTDAIADVTADDVEDAKADWERATRDIPFGDLPLAEVVENA
jgi:hypothetical protein